MRPDFGHSVSSSINAANPMVMTVSVRNNGHMTVIGHKSVLFGDHTVAFEF
jgi:hypothetical protein